MISAEFLLTSLVVVLIPGTGVIYTISTGLFQGWRASTAAAAGCTAGIIPHLTACVFGLAALLQMSALAFQVVKFAGVAYLFYLAWSMWRESGALAQTDKMAAARFCSQFRGAWSQAGPDRSVAADSKKPSHPHRSI